MMGVVWAVGIATSTATIGSTAPAAQVFASSPPTALVSQYAALVAEDTALTIDFSGTWGAIAADTGMFDVTLTAQTGTYFVAVYLNNDAIGWAALQLEFLIVNKTCLAAAPADWASPADSSVMVVETADAWAVFPSLASGVGADYCIGIAAAPPKANDTAGTYVRRPNPSTTPTAPVFVALLGRTA